MSQTCNHPLPNIVYVIRSEVDEVRGIRFVGGHIELNEPQDEVYTDRIDQWFCCDVCGAKLSADEVRASGGDLTEDWEER